MLPGCAVVDVGVSNPIPGLTKVAVVPFFNLSAEPAADGHRFAEAYFSELQKVPGFQVLPIGVAEAAIQDHRLDLQNADDAIKLAKLLGVDAVVVGAITDYRPYYPPRVGLQVSWYSAHPWSFTPGIPTDPLARQAILTADTCPNDCDPETGIWGKTKFWVMKPFRWAWRKARPTVAKNSTVFRGQSDATFPPLPPQTSEDDGNADDSLEPPRPLIEPDPMPVPPVPLDAPQEFSAPQQPANEMAMIPREPIMAYTRLFDGSDADLTATLRDYVELRDDLRGGDWEAWLHRTEDFIRFTAHRMVVEMLALHGGETRRRMVLIRRRQK